MEHCEHRGITYKFCTRGAHWVESDQFPAKHNTWDGLYSWCTPCKRSYQNERWAANEDLRAASKFRAVLLRYGIDQKRWQQMWDLFEGRCHLCMDYFGPDPGNINVDHCHRTGRVRGLLCRPCNVELGFVERVSNAKERVEDYLADGFNWAYEITPYIQKRLLPPEGDESHYEVGLTAMACDDHGA